MAVSYNMAPLKMFTELQGIVIVINWINIDGKYEQKIGIIYSTILILSIKIDWTGN